MVIFKRDNEGIVLLCPSQDAIVEKPKRFYILHGKIPFCTEQDGKFFEYVAEEKELEEWSCTEGRSSDTRIWQLMVSKLWP